MIGIALLLAAALVALAVFWKELIEWIRRAIDKIKQIVSGVLAGVKTFIVRMSDGLKNIAKYYSKDKITNEYEETVTKKAVDENEVPEELRAKIKAQMNVEVDTTEELMLKLTS